MGYGAGYKYAHDYDGKVADMECLPENLRGRQYYRPTMEGVEAEFKKKVDEIRQRRSTKPNK
jgi:putative ATPase